MTYNNKPNPDDRRDNEEKLKSMVQNTVENMEEAEATMALTESEEQRQSIQAKNERRRESINAFKNEIEDESNQ